LGLLGAGKSSGIKTCRIVFNGTWHCLTYNIITPVLNSEKPSILSVAKVQIHDSIFSLPFLPGFSRYFTIAYPVYNRCMSKQHWAACINECHAKLLLGEGKPFVNLASDFNFTLTTHITVLARQVLVQSSSSSRARSKRVKKF